MLQKYIMFIRELKNRSGNTSIQIISKVRGKYKVVKTIGWSTEQHKIDQLKLQASQQMEELERQPSLFASADDQLVEQAFSSLSNSHIRTVGPELIFGKIYDHIGFGTIEEPLFRHLVIARFVYINPKVVLRQIWCKDTVPKSPKKINLLCWFIGK